jgi:DNA polymerase-3 subunit delta'
MGRGDHDEIRAELRRARAQGRVHSAYLLEGPAGTPRKETAFWFARLLLCSSGGDDPCGRCADCRRSHADGERGDSAHPDLMVVEPEGAFIRVDQVRALQRQLGLAANEGGWRVAILLGAERLRTEAANALLKTLEEPPPRTALLLVAERSEGLPRTVRSRVAHLRFASESEQAIGEALCREGYDEADAWLVAAVCGGTTLAAREWAETSLETARDMRDALESLARASASDVLDFAQSFRGGVEATRSRLELFLAVHDAVVRRRVEAAADRGDRGGADRWLRCFEAGERMRRELIRRNLNPQMVIEGLLLEFRRAAA